MYPASGRVALAEQPSVRFSKRTAIPIRDGARRQEPVAVGFALVETLAAVVILVFGLLAAAELIISSVASTTLARSIETGAVAAQSEIERLADLYRQNPAAEELAFGGHGPKMLTFVNPATGDVLNRFTVTWDVAPVAAPRSRMAPKARQVKVTAQPVDENGRSNYRALLNKEVVVAGIFSARMP